MADRLHLEVVTPQRRVLEHDVTEVRLPGILGELGVLPGHAPLLTSLGTGELTWFDGAESGCLAVQGGFAEVLAETVTVLATHAEGPAEIDLEAARSALTEAEDALKTASADDVDDLMAAARLANTQIEISNRHQG